MNLSKSFYKIVVFIALFVAVHFTINWVFPVKGDSGAKTVLDTIASIQGPKYYFIGSSRIRHCVNPQVMRNHFQNQNIYNVAMPGSTFLSNCILADRLLQGEGNKVVFLELSPILPELAPGLLELTKYSEAEVMGVSQELNREEEFFPRLSFNLELINNYLFDIVLVKENLQQLIKSKDYVDIKRKIGFEHSYENKFFNNTPFLTFQDLSEYQTGQVKLSQYHFYISHLTKLAQQNGSKVIFFLPVTFQKQVEKQIAIPLFNSLPDSIKISYSEEFLLAISKSEHLKDINHMNSKGANVYSSLLCPLLTDYILVGD